MAGARDADARRWQAGRNGRATAMLGGDAPNTMPQTKRADGARACNYERKEGGWRRRSRSTYTRSSESHVDLVDHRRRTHGSDQGDGSAMRPARDGAPT